MRHRDVTVTGSAVVLTHSMLDSPLITTADACDLVWLGLRSLTGPSAEKSWMMRPIMARS